MCEDFCKPRAVKKIVKNRGAATTAQMQACGTGRTAYVAPRFARGHTSLCDGTDGGLREDSICSNATTQWDGLREDSMSSTAALLSCATLQEDKGALSTNNPLVQQNWTETDGLPPSPSALTSATLASDAPETGAHLVRPKEATCASGGGQPGQQTSRASAANAPTARPSLSVPPIIKA